MDEHVLAAQKAYWERTFSAGELHPDLGKADSHWIDSLIQQAGITVSGKALEIGSGLGFDTRYLLHAGCDVTALDLTIVALKKLRARYPAVKSVNHALPAPLPFTDTAFDVVVAGLSLHYFKWDQTIAIVQEIRRIMRDDGVFVFRVNATGDVAYGYGQGVEVEPNLFAAAGRYKRFFTDEACRSLFDAHWKVEALESMVITRYGTPKIT